MIPTETLPVQENPPGVQLYFKEQFANQPEFPLSPEIDTRAHLVPHVAILLVPATADVSFPVTIEAGRSGQQPHLRATYE